MCHMFVFPTMFFSTHHGLKAAKILEGHSIGCCPKGNPADFITKRKHASSACLILPVFLFSVYALSARTVDALSNTRSCFVCVVRRKNEILNNQTHMVKFNSLTIQTAEELSLAAVFCVFWGLQSQDPFPSNALKIQEVRNFPIDF